MAVGGAEGRAPGIEAPGDAILRQLPRLPLPDLLERFFALCLTPVALDANIGAQAGALVLMWFLMAIATMLPSAAPMIRTYCEIADTARIKGEPVAHPLILVAGYLSVWLAASAMFATLTLAIHQFTSSGQVLDPVVGIAGALALLVAGLYQFSGLKRACLEKCRNPFSILFSNWSAMPTRTLLVVLS
jgi:predicted metal-binding membrane protein